MNAKIKDWHDPRSWSCPQNLDPERDCACKRKVHRKPYRTIRLSDVEGVKTHGLKKDLVLEVHPRGKLIIREVRRRRVYETNVGRVYEALVWREAMLAAQEKKARNQQNRKLKKKGKKQ